MYSFQDSFPKFAGCDSSIETNRDEQGRYFRAVIEQDESMGPPWEEHDGHGKVRRVGFYERGDKRPGERMLYRGGRGEYTYLYDWAAAVKTARKDGWGCGIESHQHATAGEKAVCAAQQDLGYCRRYIEGQWYWVSIRVDYMQECDEQDGVIQSYVACLGGIGSEDGGEWFTSTAQELLAEAVEIIAKQSTSVPA